MSQEEFKIPYGVLGKIIKETDPSLYDSANHGNVLLKIEFNGLEKAYKIGDEVAEAAGAHVQRYQLFDEETNSGVWVFNLGKDEREEHLKRLKILDELEDREIRKSSMTVYLPSISKNDMIRLENKARRLLEKDFERSVESIPRLLKSGFSYIL